MNREAERRCKVLNEERSRAARMFDLRDYRQAKEFNRLAFYPCIDYGEVPDLKPGFHIDREQQMGWMD